MDNGDAESAKGTIHAVMGGLAATMALYNVVAMTKRPSPHLALNAAIYGLLWAWELYQTHRHWAAAHTDRPIAQP